MGQHCLKVLATICARGGSKGVPNKNIRILQGKPLLEYAIDCARQCPDVGDILVSTDSDDIAKIAEQSGVSVPFRRPCAFASDEIAKIHAIRHATEYFEHQAGFRPDVVVDLDVGVPLRTPGDITSCIELLALHSHLDGVVTVYESERNPYFNMVEFERERIRLVKQPGVGLVRRQDAPPVFSVSPSIFAYRRSSLMDVVHLYEGKWGACIVPRDRAIDIDDELDLQFVRFLLARKKKSY